MDIELFVSDWDGCVAAPGGGRVPWPTDKIVNLRQVIKRTPIPFILCTGRQFPYVEAALQAIGAFTDIPSVAENGAGLYFPKTKEVILHPQITPEVEDVMTDICQRVCEIVESVKATRSYGYESCISINPPVGVAVEKFSQYVQEHLEPYLDFIEIAHSRTAVDITPKGVNKGTGLKFLADITKINLDNIVGIGDSQGDLAMLGLVGHPTTPANADDNVRGIAEYVSAYEMTDGVIDIIKHYVR